MFWQERARALHSTGGAGGSRGGAERGARAATSEKLELAPLGAQESKPRLLLMSCSLRLSEQSSASYRGGTNKSNANSQFTERILLFYHKILLLHLFKPHFLILHLVVR